MMPLSPSDLQDRIDGVLEADDFGRTAWGSATSGTPAILTYQFETSQRVDFPWTGFGTPQPWATDQQDAVRDVLAGYERLINVRFVEVTGEDDPVLSLYRFPLSFGGQARWRYGSTEWDGHAMFATSRDLTDDGGRYLVTHELGHTLGLKHPGDYDVTGSVTPGPFLPEGEDNQLYSVMSYIDNPETGAPSTTPMLYDVAALQAWWGANTSTATGDDLYRLTDSDALRVIWDAGGTDRLVYDGAGRASLDLRAGAFQTIDGISRAAIAYDVTLEQATGGSGDDVLRGNGAENRLQGQGSNDTLTGGTGNDRLQGGSGNDHLRGQKGRDRLEGAGGNDRLDGGDGRDTLKGGAGADLFVFSKGRDTIRDFAEGDRIDLRAARGITDFDDLMRTHITERGGKLIIEDAAGHRMVLPGATRDDLDAGDFLF